ALSVSFNSDSKKAMAPAFEPGSTYFASKRNPAKMRAWLAEPTLATRSPPSLVGFGVAAFSRFASEGLERVKGIEPSYSAWKAAALPLSYTRFGFHVSRPPCRLNRPRPPCSAVIFCRLTSPLTEPRRAAILAVPLTTKGGDPVSYPKRCHLAGTA